MFAMLCIAVCEANLVDGIEQPSGTLRVPLCRAKRQAFPNRVWERGCVTSVIYLEKILNGYEFIQKRYQQILIPLSVLQELQAGLDESKGDYLDYYQLKGFVEVVAVDHLVDVPSGYVIHRGEHEAISLAVKMQTKLLIEEKDGRDVAQKLGLAISGIAGEVMKCFREGGISKKEALSMLDALFYGCQINRRIYKKLQQQIFLS